MVSHHSRRLGFLVLWRIIVAYDLVRLAPFSTFIFRSLLIDCILFFMEAFQASEHNRWCLVTSCICLLLDFEQERLQLVDIFVHGLLIEALLEILGAILEYFLRLPLMPAYRLVLLHPNIIRIHHLVEARFALEGLRHAQGVHDQRP